MEERVFERKIYAEMLEWKQQNDGHSALMIEGARRIGKSSTECSFGKIADTSTNDLRSEYRNSSI